MVTHSSGLEGLKAKSTAKAVIKGELLKAKTLAGYARRKYACEADAQTEYDELTTEFSKSGFGLVGGPVRIEETKHGKQGRPSKDARPELTEHWKLVADLVAPSPEYIARQVKLASTFVLMTNLLDSEQYTDADLLRHYKG